MTTVDALLLQSIHLVFVLFFSADLIDWTADFVVLLLPHGASNKTKTFIYRNEHAGFRIKSLVSH
jgi:hypothetical protein